MRYRNFSFSGDEYPVYLEQCQTYDFCQESFSFNRLLLLMSIAFSHGSREQVDQKSQNDEYSIEKIELNSRQPERRSFRSAESVKIRKIETHKKYSTNERDIENNLERRVISTNHTSDPNSVEHFISKEALQKFKNSKIKKGIKKEYR